MPEDLKSIFYNDTDGYTDRDRDMFAAGYEFCRIMNVIYQFKNGLSNGNIMEAFGQTIYRENESRTRIACAKNGLRCTMTHPTLENDLNEKYTLLKIERQ